jgi:hypothetical protein
MARRMLRRRRNALRRYKTPASTKYYRTKIDLLVGLMKHAGEVAYDWAGMSSNIYDLNAAFRINDTFLALSKQFSYVRVKAISYLVNPSPRNQVISENGYVGVSVWPRGYLASLGTWEKTVDNPFFKVLNINSNTYKYCNLLGGENDWKPTNSQNITSAQLYVITNYGESVAPNDAPQWMVKISVYCVFKCPIQ